MRILYVEDEPELADAVQQNLQREGFAVDCFATLDDAEAALQAADYDVVLLDLTLPDGDGLRLVQRLRAARDSTARSDWSAPTRAHPSAACFGDSRSPLQRTASGVVPAIRRTA